MAGILSGNNGNISNIEKYIEIFPITFREDIIEMKDNNLLFLPKCGY